MFKSLFGGSRAQSTSDANKPPAAATGMNETVAQLNRLQSMAAKL